MAGAEEEEHGSQHLSGLTNRPKFRESQGREESDGTPNGTAD